MEDEVSYRQVGREKGLLHPPRLRDDGRQRQTENERDAFGNRTQRFSKRKVGVSVCVCLCVCVWHQCVRVLILLIACAPLTFYWSCALLLTGGLVRLFFVLLWSITAPD